MRDGTIYQGEGFAVTVALYDDAEAQLTASNYEVDMLLRKDGKVAKCWSNHGARYDDVAAEPFIAIEGGKAYQAIVSSEETRHYAVGSYTCELRVADHSGSAISVERNVVRIVESYVKKMTV